MPLFERDILFDDDGAAQVGLYSHNYFLEKGEYSEILSGTQGATAVTNMYDNDATTIYQTCGGTAATITLKWDFKRQVKFLNVYAIPFVDVGTGSTNTTKIWGSNDNTNWTEEASVAQTANGAASCIATDVKWRYIKVTQTKSAATGNMGMAAVIGVKA